VMHLMLFLLSSIIEVNGIFGGFSAILSFTME
jgi:hypothetical protein